MRIYIAKPNTWFKEYTSCELVTDLRPKLDAAIFYGIRREDGLDRLDEECCNFDEFFVEEISDEKNKK